MVERKRKYGIVNNQTLIAHTPKHTFSFLARLAPPPLRTLLLCLHLHRSLNRLVVSCLLLHCQVTMRRMQIFFGKQTTTTTTKTNWSISAFHCSEVLLRWPSSSLLFLQPRLPLLTLLATEVDLMTMSAK